MPKKQNQFKGLGPAAALAKLNSLPTVRDNTRAESTKERIEREIREDEQAQIERRLQPITAEQNKLRSAAEAKLKKFYSADLASLIQQCRPLDRKASWADGITKTDPNAPDQNGLDVNAGSDVVTTDRFPAESEVIKEWEQFRKEITPRSGYVLSDAGAYRVLSYVGRNFDLAQMNPTDVSNYHRAFERLLAWDAFGDEIGFDPALKAIEEVAPEKPKTFDDVLSENSTESRAGAAAIKAAALQDRQQEAYMWYCAWYDSVRSGFGYEPTPEDVDNITSFMTRMNISYCRHESWNRARVWCVRQGLLPSHLLTADEKAEGEIDKIDANSYEGKLEIARILRRAGWQ
jgi:hypothetical protein